MAIQSEPHLHSLFRSLAQGGSLTVVLMGGLVLLGWVFDIALLKSMLPGTVTMKANTAVGLVLAGGSLGLALRSQTDRRMQSLKQACAVLVILIGCLTLVQYLSGWDFGLDQFLFKEPPGAFGTSIPGRMAPNTAGNFVLIGFGLLFLDWKTRHGLYPAQVLILLAGLIALLGLLGYVYGVAQLYGFLNYTRMAVNTSLVFLVQCLAMLFARPDTGLMAILTHDGIGGRMARRLLPVAFIVAAALGFLGFIGEHAGLYDTAFGVTVMAVTNLTVLAIVIMETAHSLNRVDLARKQADEAFREAEARSALALQMAHTGGWDLDLTDHTAHRTQEHDRIFGYATLLPQWTYETFLEHVLPEDRAEVDRLFQVATAAKTDWNFECRIRRSDGEVRWIWAVGEHQCDEAGQTRRMSGIIQDITTRKEAEAALLKAGALQSAIFNSANFSSIATDAKGVIQIFNVGAERMLGYAAADVMNKITPADISDLGEVIARAKALSLELDTPITPGFEALVFKASRGIEDIYEQTYIRKDGSRFSAVVSVTALRDAQNAIIGYLLIGTDNTARKQVEADRKELDQHLRDQQFYTRSLIESSIDALMTTDSSGIISDVNKQMEELTGCTRDELIGSPVKNYFTEPERAEASIRLVLAEKKITNYELTARAQDGRETVVSYNATTFYDRDRKLQGVVATARDITEQKRFEGTLEEKNIELEQATRMKTEFLATMSHELRTPLNAIVGFSEALKDGLIGELTDSQREYIGDIFSSGQHLLSLINDILDLSKVEAGQMSLELEEADLQSLLLNSLSIVKEKAAAHRIQVELNTDDELGLPLLDLRKTKQIVYNLLSNAVKFSPDGGRVNLCARRIPRAEVGYLADDRPTHTFPFLDTEHEHFLELSVSDNGIGISWANLPKLFKPFSQIDSSLSRKFQGTGLGLAMVKQMAELHGGTVAVASKEGEGSIFAVWLPLRVPGETAGLHAARSETAPVALAEATKPLALVIEDDDQAAKLIRMLLEAEGFAVLIAATAEAALQLAPQQTLGLITLDILLPGMDGWEFLQHIREDPTLARVPVVIIAGLDYHHLALNCGAVAVLQKPVSRAQLQTSLDQLGLHPIRERTHTILVVDDDPKAVEVIANFLPAPAYTVVRAYGGNEAIALARRFRPDLVVLDLMMPEVSGFDVVAALRTHELTASIPILVVTAKHITAQDRAALGRAPGLAIDIVEKAGFDQANFVAEVKRALMAP